MKAEDVIEMAYLLTPKERLHVVDSILKSLGPPDPKLRPPGWLK